VIANGYLRLDRRELVGQEEAPRSATMRSALARRSSLGRSGWSGG
jgi:hypothetical protein